MRYDKQLGDEENIVLPYNFIIVVDKPLTQYQGINDSI